MKMMLLIVAMVMIELSVGGDDIDKTYPSIDCDLGTVDVDKDVSCLITVQEVDPNPSGTGITITVTNALSLIDSNGDNSYCKNPRISVNFIDADLDIKEKEYFDVFEAKTTDSSALIKRCSGSDDRLCKRKTCITDEPLKKDYAVGSSVDITMFVSGEVDGVHHDGKILCDSSKYSIDSEITFKCTRGECPKYFKYDASATKCVRDCSSFAIDEYLECSTVYNGDQVDIDGRINNLKTALATLQTTVNTDHENRIGANEAAITGIKNTAIPNLQGQINTNFNEIGAVKTTIIPNLKTELEGKININTGGINNLETQTIPNLQSTLEAKISANAQIASDKADENARKIQENADCIEAFKPIVSGASAVSTNPMNGIENGGNDNNMLILSENKDLLLLMSVLINIFALLTSLVLCVKVNKANKYSKVASYASDA